MERSYALPAHFYGNPCDVLERVQEQQGFEDRLQNWRRVARTRLWQSATCWSAEGRYTAPRDETAALSEEDAEEAKQRAQFDPWPADPDVARALIADAWLFEDVWRFMPRKHRLMLALVYHKPERWPVSRVTLKLGIRRDEFGDMLHRARAMLRNLVRSMGG